MTRPLSEIDYPNTKDEWWMLVDANWEALKSLVRMFHPKLQNDTSDYKITAQAAEEVSEAIREEIRKDPQVFDLEQLKTDRDDSLAGIFSDTWFGAPESSSVHSVPKFGLLCDLCSESYVLGEE